MQSRTALLAAMLEPMMSEKFTLGQVIERVAGRLHEAGVDYGHGTETAWDEAAWLVLHIAGLSVQEPISDPAHRLSIEEWRQIESLVRRRIETRKPLAYLLHSAWFAGLEFFVDERVIVPRSPIAEMIEHEFHPWLLNRPDLILDLCTGSGCIGIACALAFSEAEVHATDISESALEVAAINLQRHGLQDRLQLYQADVFQGLPPRRYDLIVSNPPYVDAHDMAALLPEYRREPALALAAGTDGLDVVRRILHQAGDYLSEQGLLIVEVGNSQAALLDAFPRVPFIWPEFEYGGDGVFVLSAESVYLHRDSFQ